MELASRRSASTTTARCRRSNRTNNMKDRCAIDSLCARAGTRKAETPKEAAPKLAQHWQLWPAPTEIDRSGTAAYIQAAWLATLVVTFVLVGGLPGMIVQRVDTFPERVQLRTEERIHAEAHGATRKA